MEFFHWWGNSSLFQIQLTNAGCNKKLYLLINPLAYRHAREAKTDTQYHKYMPNTPVLNNNITACLNSIQQSSHLLDVCFRLNNTSDFGQYVNELIYRTTKPHETGFLWVFSFLSLCLHNFILFLYHKVPGNKLCILFCEWWNFFNRYTLIYTLVVLYQNTHQ